MPKEIEHQNFFKKPRKVNKNKYNKIRARDKTMQKEREFKNQWLQANPPSRWGYWICYLQIHPYCLRKLDIDTLVLEHVIPKSRGEKYKYNLNNVRPSCSFCNGLKGSRTIQSLMKDYPHLKYIGIDTDA